VSKDKPREEKDEKTLAVISEGAEMEGILRSTAVVHLCGTFRGRIFAENELIVAPGGTVRAHVRARKAVVAGDFEGEMAVAETIEIEGTGRFSGTLYQKAPGLVVARGGRFEGRSVLIDDLDAVVAGWDHPGAGPAGEAKAPGKPKVAEAAGPFLFDDSAGAGKKS